MNRNFTRILWFVLVFLAPLFLLAQDKKEKDYSILLNSGKFIPQENAKSVSKQDDIFRKSLFNGRYYVVIQFRNLPSQKEKNALIASGVELGEYIPNLAYIASLRGNIDLKKLNSFGLRSIFRFDAVHKTVPALLEGNVPAYAIKVPGHADLNVIGYEKMDVAQWTNIVSAFNGVVVENMPTFRTAVIRVPIANLRQLIDHPGVQWVEPVDPPNEVENLLGRTLHRVNTLNDGPRNLKGDGINVGIWDEGAIGTHIDFLPAGRLTQVEASAVSTHSTHCSGTITSRGLIDPLARGMAPNANLFSYNFNGNIQNEMAADIPARNLIVSSHSYGSTQTCGLNGAGVTYSATSRNTDLNLNNFPFHLHVHSAGNSQPACSGGWSTITASGKSAKNNILVANISSTEVLSSTSSCGPVQDGRVKPEISSFGSNVYSTMPNNSYANNSGTSMATPGVAGSVALLVQRYKQLNGNALPPSTLIKNTILNTAHDLGNAGPDYRFGYGRINALDAVRILEDNRYVLNNVATGANVDQSITVPAGAARLRVMLTWNDPAGAANANPALVNNLDLTVINGATTTLPWILDPNNPATPAVRGVDVVSNIEQVTIDNPPAGSYTLRVNGLAVTTGPNQEYALTWSVEMPYIEVIYPNGNESFNPGSSQTITWNATGVTGTQTVEFTTDGTNWTTIGNAGAGTTRMSWTAPTANTSTAKVRVTSAAITDQSDDNFKIIGTPVSGSFTLSGISCNAGEVIFNWAAVTNATHYDLMRINETTGAVELFVADVTGTTYTASGLTPNTLMWFTIVAKNNTTGAVSERTFAKSVTVSNGGGGLGAVGSITGQTNICGTPTGVSYSIAAVPGANSYTWTVPPGATISGGQGTTSITVSYGAGSSSGNVSVFASNGSCQTAPAVLAVTVGSTAVAAPVSGGNQSQAVCPPATIPTLTATATVPAGHTLIWYSANTGGTVVSNPTLSAAGTVTYYAASVNNTTNCESATRTAVTLTITTVAQAAITAGGPITFCQGGSVQLTANTGTTYLWSNGATTQSITVNATGTFSVTVTTSGCTTTSSPVNVTVNPVPVAAITANGPTTFCSGGNVVLTASAGNSYLWSNGATTQSITVSTTGNYSVTVSNPGGCNSTSAVTAVTVSAQANVSVSAAPYTRLLPGLTTTLTANVNPPGAYTYRWTRDGVEVAVGPSNTIVVDPQHLGSYAVTVSGAGICTGTSNAVAISDSTSNRLYIMPNPNSGEFEVAYYGSVTESYSLRIYDTKGALVYNKTMPPITGVARMHVDLRHHGKGLYLLVLGNNKKEKIATAKVSIQH